MGNLRRRSAITGWARAALLAVAVPGVAVLVVAMATAQPRKQGDSGGGAHTPARAGAPRKAPSSDARDAGVAAARVPTGQSPSPGQGAIALSDAGVVESRTLDGGTRVFKFSELDIEGRLKSPQLVYFLRRVRAEFAAEELGHRTFLREMSETRKESSF
jgi:hypothetical protein